VDNFDIVYTKNKWKFKKQGSERSIKNSNNKEDLVKYMQGYMKNKTGSVKIHKKNGKYQEERTYQRADDSKSTKG